jgi:hypothetical protein
MTQKNLQSVFIFISLITLAVLSRTMSHSWNFTVLGGVALFAGAYFQNKTTSFVLIFLSLVISDAVIGFHNQMASVYLSYFLIVGLGTFLKTGSSRLNILGTSLLGSSLFFLITNFSVWFEGSLYPQNFHGLIQSYIMGEPFFRYQFFSDLLATVILFETAKAVTKYVPDSRSETSGIVNSERSNY